MAADGDINETVPWPQAVKKVVICIGTQKAATSFLYTALSKHPNICVSPTKEVHYWDVIGGSGQPFLFRRRARRQLRASLRSNLVSAMGGAHDARRQLRADWRLFRLRHSSGRSPALYRDYLLTDHSGQSTVFEASPGYALCPPDYLRRMASVADDTRLILLLRDPVDRLWSASKYLLRRRLADGRAGEQDVIERFRSRLGNPNSQGYLHSDYAGMLNRIEAAGIADRVTVLFQETMPEPGERACLQAALGFDPGLDYGVRSNTHRSHVESDASLLDEATEVFRPVYDRVRADFGARVPSAWRG